MKKEVKEVNNKNSKKKTATNKEKEVKKVKVEKKETKDNKNKEEQIKKIIFKSRINLLINIALFILIISFFVVGIMLGIKYGQRQVNEEAIKTSLKEIEKEFENVNEETQNPIEASYKGYKVKGIIEIPKIKIKYPIIDGTTEETMKYSITKFHGKGVNEIGNLTLAGHNNKDGTMFGDIKYLEEGDSIFLTDLTGNKLEYTIFKKYTIDPNDISCVESVQEGTREVTLITCTNGHINRLIFKAREQGK